MTVTCRSAADFRSQFCPRADLAGKHSGFFSLCPLTGLERDKFDNKTVTFEEHIKEEHNMWHYLCFIVLVKVKDSTEYTGPESYVAEMIKVSLEFCFFFSPRLDQFSGILGTVLCIVFNLFCKCTCDFPASRALCVCAGVGDSEW